MVLSTKDFTKKMHFEDLQESIDNIENIIDYQLNWYVKQMQPDCDKLLAPCYMQFGLDRGNCIYEERHSLYGDRYGMSEMEREIGGRALSIKSNLVHHGNLQQDLIKQAVVHDYQNAGWHSFWGRVFEDDDHETLIISLVDKHYEVR